MAAIDARDTLEAGGERYEIHRLGALADELGVDVGRLPYSMKVLLENLLRHNDGVRVTDDDVAAVARWDGRPRRAAASARSRSCRPGCSCRTSPACPRSSTWPPCATPSPSAAPTPQSSTPSSPPTS